jgi:outer membrane protein assembly factor BamB
MKILSLALISLFSIHTIQSQNWQSLFGGNSFNNISPHYGIKDIETPLWVIQNAAFASLGGNVYSHGNRFVTTRWNFSSGKSIIECRNLLTGQLIWTSPNLAINSKLHAMAFNEDAVYSHDYDDDQRMFYALNPQNGEIKWSRKSYTFGPLDSPIFDCDRNPIINSSLDEFNMDASLIHCLDKNTGEIIWTVKEFVVLLPNKLKAAYEQKLYMVSGSAIDPKKLVAIDMNNGEILYYSEPIQGQASQNIRPFIGQDGTIYCLRDGGLLFSYTDTGNGFQLNWQYTVGNYSLFSMPAIENDGNILIIEDFRIKRLNKANGQVISQSVDNNFDLNSSLMVSKDSIIYLNDKEGKFIAVSYDLQSILWTFNPGGGNYYSFPNLGRDGIMVLSGSGNKITAFGQKPVPLSPVADFLLDSNIFNVQDLVSFTDFSSNIPSTWLWTFEEGTPPTSTSQNPTVSYNQAGTYSVSLKVSNPFGSDSITKHCYITVQGSLTNTNWNDSDKIIIYPNPSSTFISFKNVSNIPKQSINIFSVDGRLVLKTTLKDNENYLDISFLNSGVYYVTFEERNTNPLKFLKN